MRRLCNVNWLFSSTMGLMTLLLVVGGWLGCAANTAANEAREAGSSVGEHMAAVAEKDKAVTRMLEGMENRQIHMGERIDGIFQKLGE